MRFYCYFSFYEGLVIIFVQYYFRYWKSFNGPFTQLLTGCSMLAGVGIAKMLHFLLFFNAFYRVKEIAIMLRSLQLGQPLNSFMRINSVIYLTLYYNVTLVFICVLTGSMILQDFQLIIALFLQSNRLLVKLSHFLL